MPYHFENNEYYHLIGKSLLNDSGVVCVIQGIYEERDFIYNMTDGHLGNAYKIYLSFPGSDEMDFFHFRHFEEVVAKYGKLIEKLDATLTTQQNSPRNKETTKLSKWAKIYPEK